MLYWWWCVSFLGIRNENWRFVKNFALTARPLTALASSALRKNLGDPGSEELAACNSLKQTLLGAPFLELPHSHGTFVIDDDAYDTPV